MATAAYRNHIRGAAGQVAVMKTQKADPCGGCDQRRKVYAELDESERKRLQKFRTSDGRTEADVFLVFSCRPLEGSAVCVETDTPPLMLATGVIGLDNYSHPDSVTAQPPLCVPVYARSDRDWRASMPAFDKWLFGSVRYPLVSADRRTVRPTYHETKSTHAIDEMETYFALMTGTLQQAFATGDDETMGNFWRVFESFQNLVQLRNSAAAEIDPNAGDKGARSVVTTAELAHLILHRNESHTAAVAYKAALKHMHPRDYYAHLYRMMAECPEALHTSHLTRIESLLFALLITHGTSADPKPVTLVDLEVPVLRMTLERAMRRIPRGDRQGRARAAAVRLRGARDPRGDAVLQLRRRRSASRARAAVLDERALPSDASCARRGTLPARPAGAVRLHRGRL
eukprot:TRINITY_DN14336_c0_g1_i1.p1 TRINITY_DN14336_c0_g1~~TRINITY_DN14336_c0_g1_i1.p1  ORF type:complete len:400 (+),score=98.56 TRINITY_DN14336_c0_g1_i1:176-1375(+)